MALHLHLFLRHHLGHRCLHPFQRLGLHHRPLFSLQLDLQQLGLFLQLMLAILLFSQGFSKKDFFYFYYLD
jgi:hypothetical protein